jgi:hypothetical protein
MNRAHLAVFPILFFFAATVCPGQSGTSSSGGSGPSIPKSIMDQLRWLSAAESPFGIPVFDTSAFAATMVSATSDPSIAAKYTELTKSLGKEFIGQHPPSYRAFAPNYSIRLLRPLADGAVFISSAMEEKWNIYLYASNLYFVRSWSGRLEFRAKVRVDGEALIATRIEYDPQFADSDPYATAVVDFLIKSHIFRLKAVAPIDPRTDEDSVAIAMSLFSNYGRLALYAARRDTISIAAKSN